MPKWRVGARQLTPRRLSVYPVVSKRIRTPTDERTYMSINRNELVAAVAERASLTKSQADAALSALQDVLVDSVSKGEAVKITGLLSVERVSRAARTGRNPRTGEEIQIPAGYGVKITAGSTLKKAASGNN